MADLGETTERLVAAVERAVAVLGALADAPDDLGTNEIARRTGINASSVSRLLATLAKDEYVRRVPGTGRYRLGLRLIQLGNSALARVDFREVVRPHLIALMEATGETATLSVPGGDTTMTVDFVQSPSSVRSVAEIGRPSIGHATAIGKIFLAYGGTLKDGSLHSYTDRTITDRRELARDVAAVRERGWAQAVGEREPDLNAVAVAVLDSRGELMAVLGLQGPAWRFDAAAMLAAVARLQEHAATLTPSQS
jgi:IclR family acetate operon transcriptional repressor